MARTAAEINAEMAQVRQSMNKIYATGEEHRIDTGGTSIRMRRASLPQLQKRIYELETELAALNPDNRSIAG